MHEMNPSQNLFTGDAETVASFTAALNNSRVRRLSLSLNSQLSDEFAAHFFPMLASPFLETLSLNAIGFTSASAVHITSYIRSSRARPLKQLTLNENYIGRDEVYNLINTLCVANFQLTRLELWTGNVTSEVDLFSWQNKILSAMRRNYSLLRDTRSQAIYLLRHARPILLSAGRTVVKGHLVTLNQQLNDLPLEIIHYILSFLAPVLSTAQWIRVLDYAADPKTLPSAPCRLPVLSRRPSPSKVKKPISLAFSPSHLR